jgi:hypothetical protein
MSRLARAIRPIRHTGQYRLLSSNGHNEHHEYRKEGKPHHPPYTIADLQTSVDFTSSFWRNSILFSALVVAFYKFAPTPNQDVYLTRWLAKLSTPLDVWENINAKHLHLAQQLSADTLLTSDARMSTVHRYRYPQLSVIFVLDDIVLKS